MTSVPDCRAQGFQLVASLPPWPTRRARSPARRLDLVEDALGGDSISAVTSAQPGDNLGIARSGRDRGQPGVDIGRQGLSLRGGP